MVSLRSIIWVFLLDNFSRKINLLLTKLAWDRPWRISALGLFCTDLAALGPYCQDLGPIFSQYGPRAWLIRYIYIPWERALHKNCYILYHAIENTVAISSDICTVHYGKVGCNTIKYMMAFLFSDWLHFLRHGINAIIYFVLSALDVPLAFCLMKSVCYFHVISFRMFWQFWFVICSNLFRTQAKYMHLNHFRSSGIVVFVWTAL